MKMTKKDSVNSRVYEKPRHMGPITKTQKEKIVKTHTRHTKLGRTVVVKQHTAKYDASEGARNVARKKGAGEELKANRLGYYRKPSEIEHDLVNYYAEKKECSEGSARKLLAKMPDKQYERWVNSHFSFLRSHRRKRHINMRDL